MQLRRSSARSVSRRPALEQDYAQSAQGSSTMAFR